MKILIATNLLLAFNMGCWVTRIGTEHVILNIEPQLIQIDSADKILGIYPFNVQITRLKLAELYDKANVIIRRTDYSIKFSRKGRWAIRPNITATDLLLEVISSNLKLQNVNEYFIDKRPDYVIGGEITTIEKDLRNNKPTAAISIILWLKRFKDNKVLFQKKYSRSQPCIRPDYSKMAKQISLILVGIYSSFVLDLTNVFNQEFL